MKLAEKTLVLKNERFFLPINCFWETWVNLGSILAGSLLNQTYNLEENVRATQNKRALICIEF